MGALAIALGVLSGYSLSFVLLTANPQFLPSTWRATTVLVPMTLATCAISYTLLSLWRRGCCGGWRALVIAAPILGVLLVALPPSAHELKWVHGVGPERGKAVWVFSATSWGSTDPAFELHASDVPEDPETRWPWWASADLSGLRRAEPHQLELRVAQPENSVFDPATGAMLTRSDGVYARLLAIQAGARRWLWALRLTPQNDAEQRHWLPLTVSIPPGAERLVLEVRPGPAGSTNWFDRLWVHCGGVTPLLLGGGGSRLAMASRLFTVGWGAWVLTCLLQLIDAALSGERSGPALARTAHVLRRAARRHWLSLVGAGAIVVAFLPVIQADYGKLDDYSFLWASNAHPEEITHHDRIQGRFLAAFVHRWAFESITTISDIRYVRGLTVAALAVFAAGFAVLLRVRGWPPLVGAALAVLVCTAPSAQSTVGFGTSVHRPFAALCALLACGAASRAAASRAARRTAAWFVVATGALVGALFFQQSWAMFYVTCCFVAFFRADRESPEPRRWRLLGIQAGTFLTALAVAAGATWYVAEPTPRTALTHEPYAKLVWFLEEPLVNAASLFQITPSHATVALVAALIVLGSAAFLWRRSVFAGWCLLSGLALLPLAYLPNLLTAESWASYRSIGPLSGLILVLVAWAALGIARAGFRNPRVPATALVVGLAFWSSVTARSNVLNHIVLEQVAERQLFRAQLLRAAEQDVAAVHIIQAPYDYWPARTYRYEDFGVLSSCADWCPEPMFRLISAELPDPLAQRLAGVPVTWGHEPKEGDDLGLLQIDMRQLRELVVEHL